jgi:hypothetical protein
MENVIDTDMTVELYEVSKLIFFLCYNGTFVLKTDHATRQKNIISMKIWTFHVFLFYHMQTIKVSPLIFFF